MDLSTSSRALKSLLRRSGVSEAVRSSAVLLQSCGSAAEEQWRAQISALSDDDNWEAVAVALCCCRERLSAATSEMALRLCHEHLHHEEARVRSEVAKLLGAAAETIGVGVYDAMREKLLDAVEGQMARSADTAAAVLGGAQVHLDDTTGWKSLESSLMALRSLLDGLRRRGKTDKGDGQVAAEALRRDAERICVLVELLVGHQNRHVRQATYQMLDTVAKTFRPLAEDANRRCPEVPQETVENAAVVQGKTTEIPVEFQRVFKATLSMGLGDNWSQVRYEASVATRSFMLGLREDEREEYLSRVMPPMCLNRHYLAEGVRLYSQTTWRLVYGNKGISILEKYMSDTVDCYVLAAERDNHVVREAACAAIAELGLRLRKEILAPHVGKLLDALIICFKDQSWPVRDAACVASGQFCFVFGPSSPTSARNLEPAFREQMMRYLQQLLPQWLNNLGDPIWSVREGAAVALGRVCQAYASAPMFMVVERACQEVAQRVLKLREQTYIEDKPNKAVDQQLFSCGSLAPKLKRGGCSDCDPGREAMPWEHADGALYLLRELSGPFPALVVQLLPRLSDITKTSAPSDCGGKQHPYLRRLRDTLWRVLPEIAANLGKTRVRETLQDFRMEDAREDAREGDAQLELSAKEYLRSIEALLATEESTLQREIEANIVQR